MATSTPPVAAEPLKALVALRASARALCGGLAWGGVMLLVLAAWLAVKEAGAGTATYLIGAAGIVGLLLALWQGIALATSKGTPGEQTAALTRQRRVIGLALLAGGVLLFVLSLVLGLTRKADAALGFTLNYENFGPAVGLFLFSLFTLGTGLRLQSAPGAGAERALEVLRKQMPLLKIGLGILGLAFLGVFVYLAFSQQLGAEYYPELLALLLLGALCFATIIWLGYTPSQQLEATYLRAGILTYGGAAGLILFLMALGRAMLWRQEIFLGGMSAWQGEGAWRFWLVAYLQLVALGLVFGCFSLARTDVRNNPGLRRLLYGYNTFFQCLLVLELLVVLVVVVYAMAPYTFQWSKQQGMYALSNSSKNLLSSLKRETHAYVLMSTAAPGYDELRNLLENAQAQTNKLDVKYISPDRDPIEYDKVAKLFPKILPDVRTARREESGRGVLLVYGPMPTSDKHDVKYAFIPERKLSDQRFDQATRRPVFVFNGEGEVMRELNFLVQNQVKRRIYVLQGYGAPDVNEKGEGTRRLVTQDYRQIGLTVLADRLRKENYEVFGLSFETPLKDDKTENLVYAKESGTDKKKEVPDDTYALVVAGVSRPLPEDIVGAATRYMDRNGKMLVFLDVVTDEKYTTLKNTGLEPLLKRFGVEVQPSYALRYAGRNVDRSDPTILFAAAPIQPQHPLAAEFIRSQAVAVMRLSARLLTASPGGSFKAEPLLQLEFRRLEMPYLAEKSVGPLREPIDYMLGLASNREMLISKLSREPLNVAMIVSETDNPRPRLLVFGDTDFITNEDMMRSQTRDISFDLILSSLESMAEHGGLVGARPKETTTYVLPAANVDSLSRMVHVPGWLMLLTLLGLGTGIWLVRRR